MVLAAISCSHTNKALPDLIKIHARKMEADSFRKGYPCVCMCVCHSGKEQEHERERERAGKSGGEEERERVHVFSDAGDK